MSHQNLRSLHAISHNELEEPSLGEYVYCRECQDYVHEHCSIHSPLRAVPNIKTEEKFQPESPESKMQISVKDEVENCNSNNAIENDQVSIDPITTSSEASGKYPDENLTNFLAILEQCSSSNLMDTHQRKTQAHPPSFLNVMKDDIDDDMLLDGNGDFEVLEIALNSEKLDEEDLYIKRIQAQLDAEIMRELEAEAKIFEAIQASKGYRLMIAKESFEEKSEENRAIIKVKNEDMCESGLIIVDCAPNAPNHNMSNNNEETKGVCIKSKRKLQTTKKPIAMKKPKFHNKDVDAGETDLKSETNLKKETFVRKKQSFQEPIIKNIVNINLKRESKETKTYGVPMKQRIKTPNNYKCTRKGIIDGGQTSVINKIRAKFECNGCSKQFSTKDILTDHILKCIKLKKADMLNSLLSEVYNCDICAFKTNQKRSIETHLKMHSTTKAVSCDICDYRCTDKSILKKHIRTHTGVKPFSCNICEYRCSQTNSLRNHVRTHTGEKPFSCNICEYKCSRLSHLKSHIRTHTGELPFCCNICEYRCAFKSTLKSHIRKHTGEKPYSCNVCEYRSAFKSHLNYHMKTHTDAKPFSCDVCEYRCSRRDNLTRHKRTHTGEKPFSCNVCEYRCSRKGTLEEHIRTHTGEKPFSCNVCGYKCAHRSTLNAHLRTHN